MGKQKLQIAKWRRGNSRSVLHVGESLRDSHSRLGETRPRSGMTLIELLVVIIILTTLVAAAIPLLAPAGSDRATREATRGLNTYITGAQTRATALRRPFGIALKRLSADTGRSQPITASNPDNDNGVCLEAYYVEQQPPYSGFDPSSRACVCRDPVNIGLVIVRFVCPGNNSPPAQDSLPIGWDADLFPGNTIQPGDVIEIGNTRYQLRASSQDPRANKAGGITFFPPNSGYTALGIQAQPINDTGQLINVEYDDRGNSLRDGPHPKLNPPRYWTAPAPYKILRQPTKTNDPPYQLPDGVAIDLRASGFGKDRFFQYPVIGDDNSVDNAEPVLVMFTPEGRVAQVIFSELPYKSSFPTSTESEKFDESVVDNVYLLLGKRENIPAPAVAGTSRDPTLDPTLWAKATTDQDRQELKKPVNWLGGESRWVVIGSQSGRVVSIENAFVDPGQILSAFSTASVDDKRNQQILAAREFTYEMANMGGR